MSIHFFSFSRVAVVRRLRCRAGVLVYSDEASPVLALAVRLLRPRADVRQQDGGMVQQSALQMLVNGDPAQSEVPEMQSQSSPGLDQSFRTRPQVAAAF